jgi:RNA polymerase sigma factor (sigma-70 family)
MAATEEVGVQHGLSDAELIRASATDPHAFRALYERHFEAIHRYFRRRLGREVADDLTGEVFLRAFEQRRSYDGTFADSRPWLYGIAANLLRRRRRTEVRRLRALEKQAARSVADGPGDEAAARDEALDYQAARPALLRALARLRADEREVLMLVACADLTYEEVGRALGIPVGTVRSRLHRARAHMRAALERAGLGQMPDDSKTPAAGVAVVKEDVRWMTSI